MKTAFPSFTLLLCLQLFACCTKNNVSASNPDTVSNTDTMQLKITIGANVFTATLYNNASAAAFKTRLPMTINMSELNGNEKLFDLANSLPTNASNPGTIQTGDLMLYGSNTLVLFYKTFVTPYSYTKVARIGNPSGLAAALGFGNITVKFELQ